MEFLVGNPIPTIEVQGLIKEIPALGPYVSNRHHCYLKDANLIKL